MTTKRTAASTKRAPAKKKSAAPTKKKSAAPTKKKSAASTKKKSAASTKKKSAASTKKKSAAPTKKKTAASTKKKTAASTKKKSAASTEKKTAAPAAPRPSEPALAATRAVAMRATERALTPLERDAMRKVAALARAKLSLLVATGPDAIAEAVARFIDDARVGRRPAPKGNDLRFGLGVLWGEQVCARLGWEWVHLAYPDGFAAYAITPEDRSVCCFPLVRVTRLLDANDPTTALRALYDLVVSGDYPERPRGELLVLG